MFYNMVDVTVIDTSFSVHCTHVIHSCYYEALRAFFVVEIVNYAKSHSLDCCLFWTPVLFYRDHRLHL